jgi:ribosome modulation factor
VEGFNDGLQYAVEGKSRDDCPYYDLEASSNRSIAQRDFENVQVPMLEAFVDCAHNLDVGEGGGDTEAETGAALDD